MNTRQCFETGECRIDKEYYYFTTLTLAARINFPFII